MSPLLRNTLNSTDISVSDCDSNLCFYLILRAVDKFVTKHGRFAGDSSDRFDDGDTSLLKTCLKDVLHEIGLNHTLQTTGANFDDYLNEMVRFGGCELHSISSFVAGCAAQEAIKVITGQYIPFNNTFIYNAINSTTNVYEF